LYVHSSEKHLLASSCPSVCTYHSGSCWTDFCGIWYSWLLWKSVKKIQIWLKSEKNIGHCEDPSVFHIVGSDIGKRVINIMHCCVGNVFIIRSRVTYVW